MILKWSSFIANHEHRHKIEQARDKVINLFRDTNNDAEKTVRLNLLTQHPTIVILTLDPFDNQVTTSFFHEAYNPTLTDETPPTLTALTGLGTQAIPIHIQTENLFTLTTTDIPLPLISTLMNTHNSPMDELKQVLPADTNRHKIQKVATLTPSLALPILVEEISSPWMILHSVISTIARNKPDDTEPDDWAIATPYTHLLYTLWAFCKPDMMNTNIISIARRAATDHYSTQWAENLHNTHIRQSSFEPAPFNHDPPAAAFDRLADSINNRFKKAPEESDDDNEEADLKKAWKKIGKDFQQAILFASSPDGDTVPEYPSDRLLELVKSKNGATAARLIRRWHNKLDIVVQTGMATNITKCLLTSTPDEFSIDTFSPFFTPPMRAGFQNITNDELNSLELSQHTRSLTPADIKKMTTCIPFVPKQPHEFKLQIANFGAVLGDVLTEDSILAQDITAAIQHYDDNEAHYYNLFREHKYFPVWYLNRMHFKVQSVLHQCLRAESIEDVDFDTFSIKEELRQISTQNINIQAPAWYITLETEQMAKQQQKQHNNPNNRNRTPNPNMNEDRYNRNNPNKRTRVDNTEQDTAVALTPGEVYSKLVHWKNLKKFEDMAPKVNGSYPCNNWQIRGHCFNNCKRTDTHVSLSKEQKGKYRAYVTALRKEYRDFPQKNYQQRMNNSPHKGKREEPPVKQGEQNENIDQ